jgi:hypothetical protein
MKIGGEGSDIAAPEQEKPEEEANPKSKLRNFFSTRCRPA